MADMEVVALYIAVWLASAVAWARATRHNRRTSLIFSVIWGWIAWAALTAAYISGRPASLYAALTIAACAGVAVLGARRPQTVAWQFVVLALLAVMLLPLGESYLRGVPLQLSAVRWVFLFGVLGLITLNYLPTRLGFAALLFAVAGGLAITPIFHTGADLSEPARLVGWGCVSAAPTVAWICVTTARAADSPADPLWLTFRDRFGSIWALRVQEQFNRAAANANIDARLHWCGMRGTARAEAHDLLVALLKRFGLPAHIPGPTP